MLGASVNFFVESGSILMVCMVSANAWALTADPMMCSTVPQASEVINISPSKSSLITNVAISVPTDAPNCIASFCDASQDDPEEVQRAVAAGIAEAFAQIELKDADKAIRLNNLACSAKCSETFARFYAEARSLTLEQTCGESSAEGGPGSSPSLFNISTGGGGGGSPN